MQIESILLHSAHFTAEQREVIQAIGRIDVVAGPGSGKTTVLAAKVLKLLTTRNYEDKGICCITHTNVAVKEILARLKLAGVDEIEYPNFVGTIQSFMDKFLGKNAFAAVLPGVTLKLLDDEKFYEKYDKNFRRIVQDYRSDWNVPKPSNNGCKLVILDDGSFYYTNRHQNQRCQYAINCACEWLLRDGYVSYSDLKSLSYWYLSKHRDELSVAFEERFSYLMIDEAQDTDWIQFAIINGLANGKQLNVQRFGDPYQALYTIYGSETEDSWNPRPDNEFYQTKEISETTRFGSLIAAVVRHVCVQEYEQFHSNRELNFFPKYFMTYETGDELKEKHTRLIEEAASSNPDFRILQKPDAIVGIMHSDIIKVEPKYSKEGSKQRTHERSVSEIYALVIKLLANANGVSFMEESVLIRDNHDSNLELADIIQKLAKQNISLNEVQNHLYSLIDSETISEDYLQRECKHMLQDVSNLEGELERMTLSTVHREFATIHGVKGETHRSTLLLLTSCVHMKFNEEDKINKFLKTIFPYLLGDRPDFSSDPEIEQLQRDCLKLAYVALSRPKYLLAVAIPSQDLDDEKKTSLLTHGWVEAK